MSEEIEPTVAIEPVVEAPVARRGRPPKAPVVTETTEEVPVVEEVLVAEADTEYLSPQTQLEMAVGRKSLGLG